MSDDLSSGTLRVLAVIIAICAVIMGETEIDWSSPQFIAKLITVGILAFLNSTDYLKAGKSVIAKIKSP